MVISDMKSVNCDTSKHDNKVENNWITEHKDFEILRNYIFDNQLYNQKYKSQYISAFDFLKQILQYMYKSTSVSILIERSFNINEAKLFSEAMNVIYPQAGWSYNTVKCIMCYMKKILLETAVNPSFVKKISLNNQDKKTNVNKLLPKRMNELDDDDHSKKELLKWINILKTQTNNKSKESLRMIMYFFVNTLVPKLNIDLYNFDPSTFIMDFDLIKDELSDNTKRSRIKLFLKHILLKADREIKNLLQETTCDIKNNIDNYDDGSDKHTFTPDELDLMYNQSKRDNKTELIYLLLITTGMRVGGLVNIKLCNVAEINNNKIEIKKSGRTIEKGSKWFSFLITDKIKELMYIYIESDRLSNSEYLFPSSKINDHISTASVRYMIKKLASDAGINGTHAHPHSLRHSYAHILLDCGNDPSTVSKLLGHANVSTTQAFYLKENTIQVANKANIPWLDKDTIEKRKIVPDFLRKTKDVNDKTDKRRNKQMKRMNVFLKDNVIE